MQAQLREAGELTFNVRVHPGARKTQIKSVMADGTIKIDVAAVPEEGRANAALVKFLAEEFGVAKGNVEIVAGETGRKKVVRIVA
ncbi:YggU family protein [Candidatus Peribacteria bacterium RIFCSPHIGHO2_01_FULL_55_13]|nr:MAG: YggU family protein [Candidatus Peribacteria bacterium RIFCSPHIGHO2_01_FULL_55_13]OGJ65348.1 MAG: YggU family protein [Candidatus Peribacteria bacterium RIFCSPHIGHO2_12_FULL_55_11]